MRSIPRRGLMPLSILLFAMPACTPFVATPPIVATPAACSTLLPAEWLSRVVGAPLPDGDVVGDWIAFGVAQTGQLDKANERTAAAIGIVQRCEARDAVAVKSAARRRLFGIF